MTSSKPETGIPIRGSNVPSDGKLRGPGFARPTLRPSTQELGKKNGRVFLLNWHAAYKYRRDAARERHALEWAPTTFRPQTLAADHRRPLQVQHGQRTHSV